MPAKSGASHGLAAFVTLVVGSVLSKYLWDTIPPLGEASLLVMQTIKNSTGADVPVNEQFAGAIVLMVGLSTVWGVVYHFGRHS